MRSLSLTKSLTGASANCVALAQTVAAGGSAVLNGGSIQVIGNGVFGNNVTQAVLDSQRRIQIVSASNDSSKTAHLYGLSDNARQISEILALTNGGTATSGLDYKNVTAIAFPAGTAGNVTVGTNTTGSTDWVLPNYNVTPFSMQFVTELSGSATWNLETTNDPNYFAPPTGTNAGMVAPNVTQVVQGSTIAQTATLTGPVTGWRFTITAGTGALTAQGQQAGIING